MTQYIVENKDMIQFKDMSDEDKLKIVNACCNDRDNVQVLYCTDYWKNILMSDVAIDSIYRVRAKATPLNIPWEHIKPEYKWAAMDKNKDVCLFVKEPEVDPVDNYWYAIGNTINIDFMNINTDNINWELSLTKRP